MSDTNAVLNSDASTWALDLPYLVFSITTLEIERRKDKEVESKQKW